MLAAQNSTLCVLPASDTTINSLEMGAVPCRRELQCTPEGRPANDKPKSCDKAVSKVGDYWAFTVWWVPTIGRRGGPELMNSLVPVDVIGIVVPIRLVPGRVLEPGNKRWIKTIWVLQNFIKDYPKT